MSSVHNFGLTSVQQTLFIWAVEYNTPKLDLHGFGWASFAQVGTAAE